VQALLGFVLLTAAVTWVLQIYPALTRRRALAIRLSLLRRADAVRVLSEEDVPMAANLLEDLAGELVQSRVMRFAGRLLDTALSDFAELLDGQFLRIGGLPQAVLAAYAADHGHAPPQAG